MSKFKNSTPYAQTDAEVAPGRSRWTSGGCPPTPWEDSRGCPGACGGRAVCACGAARSVRRTVSGDGVVSRGERSSRRVGGVPFRWRGGAGRAVVGVPMRRGRVLRDARALVGSVGGGQRPGSGARTGHTRDGGAGTRGCWRAIRCSGRRWAWRRWCAASRWGSGVLSRPWRGCSVGRCGVLGSASVWPCWSWCPWSGRDSTSSTAGMGGRGRSGWGRATRAGG
jgi:hypothetical protein